jgi:hypothetical protein
VVGVVVVVVVTGVVLVTVVVTGVVETLVVFLLMLRTLLSPVLVSVSVITVIVTPVAMARSVVVGPLTEFDVTIGVPGALLTIVGADGVVGVTGSVGVVGASVPGFGATAPNVVPFLVVPPCKSSTNSTGLNPVSSKLNTAKPN